MPLAALKLHNNRRASNNSEIAGGEMPLAALKPFVHPEWGRIPLFEIAGGEMPLAALKLFKTV